MKALSLTQPWATLVAMGAKRYETRSWSPGYRGLLAIHAAKDFPRRCRYIAQEEQPFRDVLNPPPKEVPLGAIIMNRPSRELPLGAIIAVAELTGIIRVEDVWNLSEQERAFGDYGPGRYAWQLQNVQALKYSIPCKGMLGLWTVPSELEAQMKWHMAVDQALA